MSPTQTLRARIARESKAGNIEAANEARAEYYAARLEEHIREVLADHALTREQRARLRALLGDGDDQ